MCLQGETGLLEMSSKKWVLHFRQAHCAASHYPSWLSCGTLPRSVGQGCLRRAERCGCCEVSKSAEHSRVQRHSRLSLLLCKEPAERGVAAQDKQQHVIAAFQKSSV